MAQVIVSPSTGAASVSRSCVLQVVYPPEPLSVETSRGVRKDRDSSLQSEAQNTAPSPFEEVFYITGELSPGYFLRASVPVCVWAEGEEYVADQPNFRLHAFGPSRVEAILSLREIIAHHLERLEKMGDQVSPQLRRDRDLMKRVVLKAGYES